jgi:hypothetical protein
MTDGSVSNPGSRRVINYRKTQAEWRGRPEYREKSAKFLKKHPWCEIWLEVGIKVSATEIHHPNPWSYQHGFEVYVDFENNGAMAVSGKKGGGHYACHNSLKVCPICKKKKCNIHAEGCKSCMEKKYPNLAMKIEKDVEIKRIDRNIKRRKDKHPCESHRKGGPCGKSAINIRCPYSPKDAADKCGDFTPRGKMGARA